MELLPHSRRGIVVSLDKERRLKLEKVVDHISPRELARWQRMNSKTRHVIAAAHHSLALTLTVPVKLDREGSLHAEPVGTVELENLLAQTMVKVFNQHRESASRVLGVDELDAILVGNKVHTFRIDGHHVMNPLGFVGRTLHAILELTLTTREVFEDWREFFNAPRSFFFTEIARAELAALHKTESLPLQLVIIERESGAAFILDRAAVGTMMYRTKLEWGGDVFHKLIGEHLGVSEEVARKVYHLSTKGHTSDMTLRSLQKVMKPALQDLFTRLEKTKLRGHIFVDVSFALPFVLPHKSGRLTFASQSLTPLLQQLGFTLDLQEWPYEPPHIFRRLAPFVQFYYDKNDTPVNHWLRRRLHWLAPL